MCGFKEGIWDTGVYDYNDIQKGMKAEESKIPEGLDGWWRGLRSLMLLSSPGPLPVEEWEPEHMLHICGELLDTPFRPVLGLEAPQKATRWYKREQAVPHRQYPTPRTAGVGGDEGKSNGDRQRD